MVKITGKDGQSWPVAWGEIPLETVGNQMSHIISAYGPDAIIIESVVGSGRLNKNKQNQIRAHDRVWVESLKFNGQRKRAKTRTPVVEEITPEQRKRCTQVPKQVTGTHAKDAYKQAVAWFRIKHSIKGDTDGAKTDSKNVQNKGRNSTKASS